MSDIEIVCFLYPRRKHLSACSIKQKMRSVPKDEKPHEREVIER